MERFGAASFEDDDEEQDLNPTEFIPPQPEEEPGFLDRVREILGFDDDEEEDDEESGDGKKKRKKGIFGRLFSRVPGVVDVEHPVEENSAPEELPGFSLSFIQAETIEPDEPMVEPHTTEPVVVHPEVTAEEPAPVDLPSMEEDHSDTTDLPIAEAAPDEIEEPAPEEEPEFPTPPPIPPVGGAPDVGEPTTALPTPVIEELHDHEARATDPAVINNKKSNKTNAGLATAATLGVGAAGYAHHRAKVRERKLKEQVADVAKSNDKLAKKVAEQQKRLDYESLIATAVPVPVGSENAPKIDSEPRTIVQQQTIIERQTPGEIKNPEFSKAKVEEVIPPQPVALRQETRHEVKDEPGKVPPIYASPDTASKYQQSSPVQGSSVRSTLVGLSPNSASQQSEQPMMNPKTPNQSYQKAVISGLVTGLVILGIAIAFFVLR